MPPPAPTHRPGDDNHDVCVLLNEAYQVLSDPAQRSAYNAALDAALEDEGDGYTGELLSRWCANSKMGKNEDPNEQRAVFVVRARCTKRGRGRVRGPWGGVLGAD